MSILDTAENLGSCREVLGLGKTFHVILSYQTCLKGLWRGQEMDVSLKMLVLPSCPAYSYLCQEAQCSPLRGSEFSVWAANCQSGSSKKQTPGGPVGRNLLA